MIDYNYLELLLVIGLFLLIVDCGFGIYLKIRKLLEIKNDKNEV
jgi:hypothetical protein